MRKHLRKDYIIYSPKTVSWSARTVRTFPDSEMSFEEVQGRDTSFLLLTGD